MTRAMTEPTLEQWKERALVAEALLEEMTGEAERLRMELDKLAVPPRIKSGDKITFGGGKAVYELREMLGKDIPPWMEDFVPPVFPVPEPGLHPVSVEAICDPMTGIARLRLTARDLPKGAPREVMWELPAVGSEPFDRVCARETAKIVRYAMEKWWLSPVLARQLEDIVTSVLQDAHRTGKWNVLW